jgi:hypothetical protein
MRSRSGQMLHPAKHRTVSRSTPKGWTLPDVYDLYQPASHIKLTCKKIRLITCVAPHTKSKGLPIGSALFKKK